MSSLESWAVDKLSVFLGFDSETIETQILPFLMSSDSPDRFAEQLMEMVGTSEDALSFIQEFTERRFQPKKIPITETAPVRAEPVNTKTSAQKEPQEESSFPSLPKNQQSYETMWPANINVHQKKEDDYFAGLRKVKKSKNKLQVNATKELRAAAFPSEHTAPKKEKPKKSKEMTLEAALKELDIKAEQPGKKRKPCQCQATKHPLLAAAPNCLSCGKIICTSEGVGPCTFCGSPVLSKEQQVALIAEAKRKRTEAKQQQNASSSKRAPSGPNTTSAYASKAGGSGNSLFNSPYQSDNDDQNRINAEMHKEKLLEFQRTSAQRSTVIDQATDFELPTDQSNPWLTPQERALLLKKQQSNLKRIERKSQAGSNRHKVMTIDVQTKQVRVQDAETSSSSDEETEPVKKMTLSSKKQEEDKASAGTYAQNPLLKGINAPKFIGKQSTQNKGRMRRKERVQYEVDDIMNDYLFSSNLADFEEIDPVNEPITCG
ncbi:putative zinc finger motif, C2HC5-type-domain-containing protein [Blakeslea trispora]|nr:putative zinc finger motif, C2HC5-type-domain-containing protein [Blakeslea trispora]